MIDFAVVDLSRLQFALTALYHFLFVPLTMGLSFLLAIMESVYVMTGREIWRQMTKFWGLLFGINFAMGVATGLTMEFQFGTNWAYFSHYVGDIFGVPLAIEGMMAFFLEASFVGLFFFGWDRLSKIGHLCVTWLVAIGSNFSALWILIANGWMQNPVGAKFNFETMRMEIESFAEVILNPVAQAKFVHTVSAGYVVGAMFVLAISAFYLLKSRHVAFAKRSMTVAASFGLASALSVVVLGDESGYYAEDYQKMKIASLEAMWETKPAPAPITLFGIPDPAAKETLYKIEIPFVLGLIATRSYDTEMPGINDLVAKARARIKNGLIAYEALQGLIENRDDWQARKRFRDHEDDLGHALLLKKYRPDIENADTSEIDSAAGDTVPNVPVMFYTFRVMVACGFYFIAFFAFAFYLSARRQFDRHRWFLHLALWSLPLPWIAAEAGWIIAEYGRQPWIISEILPTFLGVSSVSATTVIFSLTGFVLFYTTLLAVDLFLMVKYVRIGPKNVSPQRKNTGKG